MTLDQSFGNGGIVMTAMGESDDPGIPLRGARALVIEPDGKILVAGEGGPLGLESFALVRYDREGKFDPGFGDAGIVTTPIGGRSDARALALQGDGRIVIAGSTNPEPSTRRLFALARYDRDGTLDAAFGQGGIVTTAVGDLFDEANAVAIQSDDKIVAVGQSAGLFAWARYLPNGALDPSFGSNGFLALSIGAIFGQGRAQALAFQSDGQFLAAGATSTGSFRQDVALVRCDSRGLLDPDFGSMGTAITEVAAGSEARAIAIQSDGKIVVAGGAIPTAVETRELDYGDVALFRYTRDGVLDTTFGESGIVRQREAGFQEINGMVIDPKGRILVAGGTDSGGRFRFLLARYLPSGGLDRSFAGGVVETELGLEAEADEVALQSDGRILVAGSAHDGRKKVFVVTRFIVQ